MKHYCPIFRENTERIFPSLVNSVEYGTAIRNSIVESKLFEASTLPKIVLPLQIAANNTTSKNAEEIKAKAKSTMQIHIVNMDSIECARVKIIDELKDGRPCILNMASD